MQQRGSFFRRVGRAVMEKGRRSRQPSLGSTTVCGVGSDHSAVSASPARARRARVCARYARTLRKATPLAFAGVSALMGERRPINPLPRSLFFFFLISSLLFCPGCIRPPPHLPPLQPTAGLPSLTIGWPTCYCQLAVDLLAFAVALAEGWGVLDRGGGDCPYPRPLSSVLTCSLSGRLG